MWSKDGEVIFMPYYITENIGCYHLPEDDVFLNPEIKINVNEVDRERLLGLLKTNNRNTKETEKMEAKKCDRCGKLYEMLVVNDIEGAEVRFKFIKVSDAENKSGTLIAKEQMRKIYIRKGSSCDSYSCVDLCPECRKSFKKWFESTDKEEK